MKKVLITGASGTIGLKLTKQLLNSGYRVAWLSRSKKKKIPNVSVHQWDINQRRVDDHVFEDVDAVIHLAGASIGDGRWTEARKREILMSRIRSTEVLTEQLHSKKHQVKSFISASAIGFYAYGEMGDIRTETDGPGTSFQSEVCVEWESRAHAISALGIRTAMIRTGVVFDKDDGAFPKLAGPAKWGLNGMGDGRQPISWIHVQDICRMYQFALEHDNITGPVNAVAPQPVSNEELVKAIALLSGVKVWSPKAPSFMLHLALGEMAELVLKGVHVSSKKIENLGFQFSFPTLDAALRNLLGKA